MGPERSAIYVVRLGEHVDGWRGFESRQLAQCYLDWVALRPKPRWYDYVLRTYWRRGLPFRRWRLPWR